MFYDNIRLFEDISHKSVCRDTFPLALPYLKYLQLDNEDEIFVIL